MVADKNSVTKEQHERHKKVSPLLMKPKLEWGLLSFCGPLLGTWLQETICDNNPSVNLFVLVAQLNRYEKLIPRGFARNSINPFC